MVGLDTLAVTDHDEISADLRAAELTADYGLVGIPGMEVACAAGHVLILDVEKLIPVGLSYDEALDHIRDVDGTTAISHPFQKSRHSVASCISSVQLASADVIEIYNSRLFTSTANQCIERPAERWNLPITAGSDAYAMEMVRQAVTEIGTDTRGADAILSAVTDERVSVVGNKTPWRILFRQTVGGTTWRLKRALTDLF